MTEFEVKVVSIDYQDLASRLTKVGAIMKHPKHLLKVVAFLLPEGRGVSGGWLRVREEKDRITMALKIIGGDQMRDQKEYSFSATSVEDAVSFLEILGAKQKSYQEKRREIWELDGCEIVIDECPFIEPYMEVEGPNEAAVQSVVEKLGYDFSKARVCSVTTLYREKYQIEDEIINNKTPKLVFDMENPFSSHEYSQ